MLNLGNLVEQCQEGDQKALGLLYDKMKGRWMGICVRYSGDPDDAKDIFQDATLKIFTDIGKLGKAESFPGWARKIIINCALNHLKKRRSYLFMVQENYTKEIPLFDRTSELLISSLDYEVLLEIIKTMPEGYRTIFNMAMIDDFTHKEIAVTLNITESTSRSQLTKAKQFLKRLLENLKTNNHGNVIGL